MRGRAGAAAGTPCGNINNVISHAQDLLASIHYNGNSENPIFTFRLGRIGIASTGIYSLDRSVFTYAASGATERRLMRVGDIVTLDRNGSPIRAS